LASATPNWRRLFEQAARRPASRAACTAGRSNATSKPMMAMTTSSSTIVKADRRAGKLISAPVRAFIRTRDSAIE